MNRCPAERPERGAGAGSDRAHRPVPAGACDTSALEPPTLPHPPKPPDHGTMRGLGGGAGCGVVSGESRPRRAGMTPRRCRLRRSLPVARRTAPTGMRAGETAVRAVPREAGLTLGGPGAPRRTGPRAGRRRPPRDGDRRAAPRGPRHDARAGRSPDEAAARHRARGGHLPAPDDRPGRRPITAPAERATIDDPGRLAESRAVGARTPPVRGRKRSRLRARGMRIAGCRGTARARGTRATRRRRDFAHARARRPDRSRADEGPRDPVERPGPAGRRPQGRDTDREAPLS